MTLLSTYNTKKTKVRVSVGSSFLIIFLLFSLYCNNCFAVQAEKKQPRFIGERIYPIPENIKSRMLALWKPNCPVNLNELTYLKISHWDYNGKVQLGELIVHNDINVEVILIFHELFKKQFPIEKMRLIYEYNNNDNKSMKDNNTSAFNCRLLTGSKTKFSKHSYGKAIDVNPLVNPYVKNNTVLPPEGRKYLNRNKPHKGMVIKGNACYNAFVKRGWQWGGDWKTLKDYQHFEKYDFK